MNEALAPDRTGRSELSVVIPCRNGLSTLGVQLQAVLEQTCTARLEVVVADNGSTDGTRALVEGFSRLDPRVTWVDASRGVGVNVARNVGVESTHGRFIALCDADDVVQPGWAQAMVDSFRSGAEVMGGRCDAFYPDLGFRVSAERLPVLPFIDFEHPVGSNCGFSRRAFDEVGGFDESLRGGGDEVDFFLRAVGSGYQVRFVPDARIEYRQRAGDAPTREQHRGYGRGLGEMVYRHGTWAHAVKALARIPFGLAKSCVRILVSRPETLRRRHAWESMGFWLGMVEAAPRLVRRFASTSTV